MATATSPNPLLDAALEYASKWGWPVFPCDEHKSPLTPHGFKDATTDPRQIAAWWRRWPNAMVAAPTGSKIGAWALDGDDLPIFQAAAVEKGIALPATRRSITSKGKHFFFSWDPEQPVHNAQKHPKKGWAFPDLPGIDVRGEGGYVILPPSVHESGHVYAWESLEEPSEAPDELYSIVRKLDQGGPLRATANPIDPYSAASSVLARAIHGEDTPWGVAALREECDTIASAGAGAQESALNDGSLKIGGVVGGGYLSFRTASAQLIAAGLAMPSYNDRHPWTTEQIAKKVDRALRDGMATPRGPSPAAANDTLVSAPAISRSPNSTPLTIIATPYIWREPEAIKPREWVYGRSIQRGHVRAIVAQGGAGKTILSVGEALAMVTGRDLLGQAVPGGPKRVWLWNLEDDMDELARIIQAACKHWRITEADIAGRLFVDSALDGAPLKLATSTPAAGLVINRPLVEALTAEMIGRGIDYLHVDPFVSSHAAQESDNMEIDTIAKEWAAVAKRANAGIGLAHHVSKSGAVEATALSARGAVSLINACRSVLVLNRMNEQEASKYGIEEEKRRRFFRTYDDKNNRAPPSDASDWFQMVSISLGNADDGYGDSMGVVVPWSPPDAFDGVTANHLYEVQRIVDQKRETERYRADVQAGAWVGRVVAEVLGLSAEASEKADRAKINRLIATWLHNGALVKVDGSDTKANPRKFIEVGQWAVQGSPPDSFKVGKGGERWGYGFPHPTSPIKRRGGGERETEPPHLADHGGEEGGSWRHGNPALGRVVEEEDDPAVADFLAGREPKF